MDIIVRSNLVNMKYPSTRKATPIQVQVQANTQYCLHEISTYFSGEISVQPPKSKRFYSTYVRTYVCMYVLTYISIRSGIRFLNRGHLLPMNVHPSITHTPPSHNIHCTSPSYTYTAPPHHTHTLHLPIIHVHSTSPSYMYTTPPHHTCTLHLPIIHIRCTSPPYTYTAPPHNIHSTSPQYTLHLPIIHVHYTSPSYTHTVPPHHTRTLHLPIIHIHSTSPSYTCTPPPHLQLTSSGLEYFVCGLKVDISELTENEDPTEATLPVSSSSSRLRVREPY